VNTVTVRTRPRLRDHPRLVALSAGVSMLEALLLLWFGPTRSVPLAPQVVAPAPYGVFHDLRWLLVYHSSWWAFVVEVALMLAFRSCLDTLLVRAAWPARAPLPAWRAQLEQVARFTAVQAIVLLPFAVLAFAMAVTSLSWLFFVFVPVALIAALVMHHGSIERGWWRNAPTRASALAALGAFGVITLGGAAIAVAPQWLRPLLAAGAGVTLAWFRLRIVEAVVDRDVSPRRRPFAVVCLVAVFALVIGGTAIGFAVSVAVQNGRTPVPEASASAHGPPVLIVKGFNSEWEGITRRWVRGGPRGGFTFRRFSYAGLDAAGQPRPYGRSETHQSLRALAREMRVQVRAFHDATGEPVNIVAESEGALVAQAYLAGTPHAPVRSIVLLSPLLAPGRVHYPRIGDNGWGTAGGAVLDGLSAVVGAVGPVDVSSDTPLFRAIVDEEPAVGDLIRCPPPGVRSFAVLPLDSGVSVPAPFAIGYRYAVVPAFHGGLLGDATSADLLRHVLLGEHASGSGFWSTVADVVNAGAAAWQAPSLEPSLEPAWHADGNGCRAVRAEMRRYLR
jgi:hypothetical protein